MFYLQAIHMTYCNINRNKRSTINISVNKQILIVLKMEFNVSNKTVGKNKLKRNSLQVQIFISVQTQFA